MCWCNFKCSEGCFFYRSGKCNLYQIESGIDEEKVDVLTSNQAREIANKFNEEERNKLNNLYLNAWLKHRDYIEANIKEQASQGKYECSSDNLYDSDLSEKWGVAHYDVDKLEDYLKSQVNEYFSKLGYEVIDDGSNILTISWREVVKE